MNKEPENVTRPVQSTRVAPGSRDSRTFASVTNTATMPIGTLTKKIHSQPIPEVMMPPTSGPTATAAPVTAPNTPNAIPRSRPWKAWAIKASDVAYMSAPPVPWSPRARLSIRALEESPHTAEAPVNTIRPITNSRRRPNRSASAPPVSRKAASVSE
jgi:hypothetical protein